MGCNPRQINVSNDATSGDDEIRRLQGFINDLISIQALLPFGMAGSQATLSARSSTCSVSMLRLDFAYARLSASVTLDR